MEPQRMRIGPATIYYLVGGEGPPLILLHGLSGSSRWWAQNTPFLTRHFRVYVIDLIGFGQSRGQPFTLHEAAGVVMQWMGELGLARASIVGHSMGGFIAADLAARFPESVARLVLVASAGIPFGRTTLQNAWGLFRALRYMPLNFFPILITDALRAGPATIVGALRQIFASDLSADLSRIRAPTLIIWGEYDSVIPLLIGEKLGQLLSHAAFVVIEGAGHNPMWDRPEQFNRVVTDFLEGTKSPITGRHQEEG